MDEIDTMPNIECMPGIRHTIIIISFQDIKHCLTTTLLCMQINETIKERKFVKHYLLL